MPATAPHRRRKTLAGKAFASSTSQVTPNLLKCIRTAHHLPKDSLCQPLMSHFKQVMDFIERHTESASSPGQADRKAHLAGNSIYVDRMFLRKYMPRVHEHLHWRLIDVSTILELGRRWYPEDFKHAPKKKAKFDRSLLCKVTAFASVAVSDILQLDESSAAVAQSLTADFKV